MRLVPYLLWASVLGLVGCSTSPLSAVVGGRGQVVAEVTQATPGFEEQTKPATSATAPPSRPEAESFGHYGLTMDPRLGVAADALVQSLAQGGSTDYEAFQSRGSGMGLALELEDLQEDAQQLSPLTPRAEDEVEGRGSAVHTDLLARIRAGLGMAPLDNHHVRKWEAWYSSRPDYVLRMTERGSRYLFHIVQEVEQRQMPTEIALLPFIESAFNPQALSTARASGIWQFMPATGRDYELKQNIFRDERRDVLESTRAALTYLESLNRMFGDWTLALAAYNWGQGNVQRAIERNRRRGLPTDYESLTMPDETRNYVPKLMAVRNIFLDPQRFGLTLPSVPNHPYFLTVDIDRDLDVALVLRLAGVDRATFNALNPQLNKPLILAAGSQRVLLPFDDALRFMANLKAHRGPTSSWTAWVAPRTMKVSEVAREVSMTEEELREVNLIPKGMVVKLGSTLLVNRLSGQQTNVSGHLADGAQISLAPELPPYTVKRVKVGPKGDTLTQMAKRYKVEARELAQWNRLSAEARLKPGQVLQVRVARSTGSVDKPTPQAGKRASTPNRPVAPDASGGKRNGKAVAKKDAKVAKK